MKSTPLFLAAMLISIFARAQDDCIKGFSKLLPHPSIDYSLDFGHSVSIHENYMAVGVPNSDTLSRESGIVYIYEKRAGIWVRTASMVSSQPIPDHRLGISVKLTENYLFASTSAEGGSVHIYRRPPSGWATASEMTIIKVPGAHSFGGAYHHPVDLSEDENTLVITDALKPHNNNPISISGSVFIFHKPAGAEWTSNITPTEIKATTDVMDLGRNGTYIRGNRIFVGTPFTHSQYGNIFIYHDGSGTFANPTLEATLSAVSGGGFWMDNMLVTDAGVFVSGTTPDGIKIYFYPRPSDNLWIDTLPACLIDPDGDPQTQHWNFLRLGATSTSIFAISPAVSGVSLTKITEGTTGWCSPSVEVVDKRFTPRYGTLLEAGEYEDVVTGFVGHPWNGMSFSALNAYYKNGENGWASNSIYSTAESTRGHGYGQGIATHGSFMFVGAPFDNTVKERGGKVYVYERNAPESPWVNISTITPSIEVLSDREFGSSVATNGEYLAVGARLWQPSRILIYRKGSAGWANPEFSQAIEVPVGELTEATYSESVVMNDRWLLVPFVDQRGFTSMFVAVYELSDEIWTYRQTLSSGYLGLFTGIPNGGVAISDDIIVAANQVYQLSETGEWQFTCTLSPSDPQSLRFAYPRFELTSNGSLFGRSVAIRENTIAIGAPFQDSFADDHVWDVGAVYVFTKLPTEEWTNRTETFKIVPTEISASRMFGWDVAFADDALVVSAPTSPTFAKPDLNQSPKNNAQGKVYLYGPDDSSWRTVSLIKTYAGETSFRDNFGVEVGYFQGDILIGASEEDIVTGRTSGAVYITDAPAIIKPAGPFCSEDAAVQLMSTQPGGIWSGNGIIDEISGEFDPSAAGPGVHEITYVNGICQRSTKRKVNVSTAIRATIEGPADVYVCPASNFSRTLAAGAVADVSYEWYYRPNAETEFVLLPQQSSRETIASSRGDYQARLYNTGCEGYSEIFSIRDESVDVVVDAPGELCATPPGGLLLSATPTGGSWSGPGVTQNRFSMEAISDGDYALDYQYTSSLGCLYSGQTTVKVKRIPRPGIHRDGNLCETGVVSFTVPGAALDGAEYTWSHQAQDGEIYTEVGSGTSYEATTWGNYRVSVIRNECEATSIHALVSDAFSSTLTPEEKNYEVCHDHDVTLTYPQGANSSFEWYFSPDGQSTEQLPNSANSLRPDKTGYYSSVVRRGICSFTGPTKYFYVHRKDSVFVPNVFTPNGDGKNDDFSFMIFHQDENPLDGDAQDIARYEIYNRYGRKVFSAPKNEPWTGSNSENGVYFWLGKYYTCWGDERLIKGYVHLVK